MTQQQSQEFINYITSLIGEEHGDKISDVMDILAQLIKGSISTEEASERFLTLFGSNEPFKKIDELLKKIKNPSDTSFYAVPTTSPNLQPQLQTSAQPTVPTIQPQLQHAFMNQQSMIAPKIPISGYRKKPRPFTAEEDQRLINAINANGTENWALVASLVGGDRTKQQCSQRWNRVINPKISKSNWSREEEQKLIEAVQEFGNKAWTRIASELGNRSDVQCRFRYRFLLKKAKENQTEIVPISASQDILNQGSQSNNISQIQLNQYNSIAPSIQEDQIQLSDQIKLNDPSQLPLHISLQLVPDQKDNHHISPVIHCEEQNLNTNQNDDIQNENVNNQN